MLKPSLYILSAADLVDRLLSTFFADMHAYQPDNFDAGRFNIGGADRSGVFDTDAAKSALLDMMINCENHFATYRSLEDQTSKDLYFDLMRYRLAGHLHVRLPTNSPPFHEAARAAAAMEWTPSTLALKGALGGLRHFTFRFKEREVALDAGSLFHQFFLGQYFYDRDGVSIAPEPGDHVIDAGACLGDTAVAFAAAVGETGHVHSFDMCDAHLAALRHNVAQNPWARVTIHPAGLSDTVQDGEVLRSHDLRPGQSVFAMDNPPLTTLDHLVASGAIERVDFIKMDIEGSELSALRGALETLRRFRPKLAVSLYHRVEDFHTIPDFLRSLDLGYRLHLDHYTIHAEETVLYAQAA